MTVKPTTLMLVVLGLVLLGVTGYYLKHEAPIGNAENASLTTGSTQPQPKMHRHNSTLHKAHEQPGSPQNNSHTSVTVSGNCKKTTTTKTTKAADGGTITSTNTSVSCADGGSGGGSSNNVNIQSNSDQSSSSGSSTGESGTSTNTNSENVLVN